VTFVKNFIKIGQKKLNLGAQSTAQKNHGELKCVFFFLVREENRLEIHLLLEFLKFNNFPLNYTLLY